MCMAGATADFERLIEHGTLDASPVAEEELQHIPLTLCAKHMTTHAVAALRSSGITRLDLTCNSSLDKIPLKELCEISSLEELKCDGCSCSDFS